jgi:hypothetical protein
MPNNGIARRTAEMLSTFNIINSCLEFSAAKQQLQYAFLNLRVRHLKHYYW